MSGAFELFKMGEKEIPSRELRAAMIAAGCEASQEPGETYVVKGPVSKNIYKVEFTACSPSRRRGVHPFCQDGGGEAGPVHDQVRRGCP